MSRGTQRADLELWERPEWMRANGELHRDRDGEPINLLGMVNLMADASYRWIAQTTLYPWDLTISTVWLGANYAFGGGPPILFETMVFMDFFEERDHEADEYLKPYDDMCFRHHTMDEAILNHQLIVQGVMEGKNFEGICEVLY